MHVTEGAHAVGGLPGRVYTNLISLTAWGDVSVYSIRQLTGVETSGAGETWMCKLCAFNFLGNDLPAMCCRQ